MAYSKKTWKARQGLGLNKFSIDGATPVPVVNQPDSVTQQGDALSAGNLNDLETRIDNAFTDVENNKADKAEVETQIGILNKRVTNLEAKAGDEISVTYPSATYGMDEVPPSVAPYSKVDNLIGVGRVHNQLINPNASVVQQSTNDIISSVGDGTFSITGTSASNEYKFFDIQVKAGRTYLFAYALSTSVTIGLNGVICGFGAYNYYNSPSGIVFSPSEDMYFAIRVAGGYNANGLVITPILRDLNTYFNTSDLSFLGATDSAKLATIQSDYPELLVPSAYDGGTVVFPTYDKVEAKSQNFVNTNTWSWAQGTINSDGTVTVLNGSAVSDYIEVTPSVAMVFSANASVNLIRFAEYNSSKGFITRNTTSSGSLVTATLNSSTKYVRWQVNYDNFTPITKAILDSLELQLRYGNARDYWTHTITLQSPVTLKGVGSVHEVYDLESGTITQPLSEEKNLGTDFSWTLVEGDGYWYWKANFSMGQLVPSSGATFRDCISDNYTASNQNRIGMYDNEVSYNASTLYIRTNSKLVQPTGSFWFALATPNADASVTPMPDPRIEVEGGGTIKPNQTQSVKIDSSMTAEYLVI